MAVPISDAEAAEHADASVCVYPPNRYGIPHDLEHECNKALLFLSKLDEEEESDQTDLRSIHIRRSVYWAYFGQPPSTEGCNAIRETKKSRYFHAWPATLIIGDLKSCGAEQSPYCTCP